MGLKVKDEFYVKRSILIIAVLALIISGLSLMASANGATGPFYCDADQKFYATVDELKQAGCLTPENIGKVYIVTANDKFINVVERYEAQSAAIADFVAANPDITWANLLEKLEDPKIFAALTKAVEDAKAEVEEGPVSEFDFEVDPIDEQVAGVDFAVPIVDLQDIRGNIVSDGFHEVKVMTDNTEKDDEVVFDNEVLFQDGAPADPLLISLKNAVEHTLTVTVGRAPHESLDDVTATVVVKPAIVDAANSEAKIHTPTDKTAGENFTILVTAKDEFNNLIDSLELGKFAVADDGINDVEITNFSGIPSDPGEYPILVKKDKAET